MFSGIIESESPVLDVRVGDHILEVDIARPLDFDDVKTGDSVAVNGVCLTVEKIKPATLTFVLAPETLKVTGWTLERLKASSLNLERSLRVSDRLHGHLVSGHVDSQGEIILCELVGESRWLKIRFPVQMKPYIWPKGSLAINGVSLTVNEVEAGHFSVCLIPETLRRTNLKRLQVGDLVNLEVDPVARGLVHWLRNEGGIVWS